MLWVATRGAESGVAVQRPPSLRGGLCRIFRNGAWHYELRPEAIDDVCCPRMYADPIQDPRMQQ
ncbi:hypothetical protein [Micromonospora fulviviridis]|uniref:hypothetical protein n=1 Tax=Micromonospora fulviviridis TaxID=47860 RepID=UPI00378E0696